MDLKVVLYRLNRRLAPVLCASILLYAIPPAIAAPYGISAPKIEAWHAAIDGFRGDPVPFLQPFGLNSPGQIDGFLRVAPRLDLAPNADLTPQQVHAAVAAYAQSLSDRSNSVSQASTSEELAKLRSALRDVEILSAIAPERSAALEVSRRLVVKTVADREAVLGRAIEETGESWDDKKDGLSSMIQSDASKKSARPSAWTLAKAAPRLPGGDVIARSVPSPTTISPISAADKTISIESTKRLLRDIDGIGILGVLYRQQITRGKNVSLAPLEALLTGPDSWLHGSVYSAPQKLDHSLSW